MAEFTHIDLRSARESRKIPRWKLAKGIGVSEDTLERWETGKQRPDPDDVGNIERILGISGLWHKWMLSAYDSYRERYVDVPHVDHPAALVMRMKHEIGDVLTLLDSIERDVVDGKIDNIDLWNRFKEQAQEADAAMRQVVEWKSEES